jgi:hypothetical protein
MVTPAAKEAGNCSVYSTQSGAQLESRGPIIKRREGELIGGQPGTSLLSMKQTRKLSEVTGAALLYLDFTGERSKCLSL